MAAGRQEAEAGMTAEIRPEELAERWGCSPRRLRKVARDLGACRVLGKAMWLTADDVQVLQEALKCPSRSTGAARSGTTAAPLPVGDYEALQRLRTRPPAPIASPPPCSIRSGGISGERRP